MKDRWLLLEDGTLYQGKALGADACKAGELVFNTSMTGYQEILTDNSYCGQIVLMTYPLIGNYGINRDNWESIEPAVSGFIVRDYCDEPNNWRSQQTLDDFLKLHDIPAMSDIDTRALTKRIRKEGTMKAMMLDDISDVEEKLEWLKNLELPRDQVSRVSTPRLFAVPNRGYRVVLMDFGSKLSIVRELSLRGCDIVVVPWNASAKEILDFQPDGVMLTNGPGDPQDVPESIETIRELLGQVPVFGICLGHQLLALACGAKTYKLKFGHRGGNHPVINLAKKTVSITSQNHSYAVDQNSLEGTGLIMSHQALNDGSCEGLRHTVYPAFSVQFHPEANAGPQDAMTLFDEFIEMMAKNKEEHHA